MSHQAAFDVDQRVGIGGDTSPTPRPRMIPKQQGFAHHRHTGNLAFASIFWENGIGMAIGVEFAYLLS